MISIPKNVRKRAGEIALGASRVKPAPTGSAPSCKAAVWLWGACPREGAATRPLGDYHNASVYPTIKRFSSMSLVNPPLERNVALRNRTLTFFSGPLCTT